MAKTIIVDLDGTISLNQHRYHYIYPKDGSKPDWDGFFLACVDDQPNLPVIEIILALKSKGYKIHIFSARGEIAYTQTVEWLTKYSVPYDDLTLRKKGCYTPDEDLKKEWLIEYYPDFKTQVLCVIDDRDKVVAMWRALGLTCLQVAEGDF